MQTQEEFEEFCEWYRNVCSTHPLRDACVYGRLSIPHEGGKLRPKPFAVGTVLL